MSRDSHRLSRRRSKHVVTYTIRYWKLALTESLTLVPLPATETLTDCPH